MVKRAKIHIQTYYKRLLKQRQDVFPNGGSGDFKNDYFAPDLVKMKFKESSLDQWIEDGPHFNHNDFLIQIINNNQTTTNNILIEVYEIFAFTYVSSVIRRTLVVVKRSYSIMLLGFGQKKKTNH